MKAFNYSNSGYLPLNSVCEFCVLTNLWGLNAPTRFCCDLPWFADSYLEASHAYSHQRIVFWFVCLFLSLVKGHSDSVQLTFLSLLPPTPPCFGCSCIALLSQWKDQHRLGGIIPIVLIWERLASGMPQNWLAEKAIFLLSMSPADHKT